MPPQSEPFPPCLYVSESAIAAATEGGASACKNVRISFRNSREPRCWDGGTYDQRAHETLHALAAEIQVRIPSRQLCKLQRDLLLIEGAVCEIGPVENTRCSNLGSDSTDSSDVRGSLVEELLLHGAGVQVLDAATLDTIEEVELDTRSGHLVGDILVAVFVVEFALRVALVVDDFDNAVVADAAGEGWFFKGGVAWFAEVDGAAALVWVEHGDVDLAEVVVDVKWAEPFVDDFAIEAFAGWISGRGIEAVEVPVRAAGVAACEFATAFGRAVA